MVEIKVNITVVSSCSFCPAAWKAYLFVCYRTHESNMNYNYSNLHIHEKQLDVTKEA